MTAKQKQCLLTYLVYDTGEVNGLWGKQVPAGHDGYTEMLSAE